MAGEIYLGLEGSEVTLPQINWEAGSEPTIAHAVDKQVDKQTMCDGSTRFNIHTSHPHRWTLEWARLSSANITTLTTLSQYAEKLHYKNTMIDSTYRWAVVISFEFSPILQTVSATIYYRASLTLEEAT
jgi:hypothetical protein